VNIPKRFFHLIPALCAGFGLLGFSGCVSIPAQVYVNAVTYEPVRSSVQIDASAAFEAKDTLSPEMIAMWKHWMNNDTNIANYASAVEQALRNDLATSGLFSRVVTDGARPDYVVKAQCVEFHPSDFRVQVTLVAVEVSSGTTVSTHTGVHSFGTSKFGYKLKEALPGLMASLKESLVVDLQERFHRQQETAARAQAELLTKATLEELLTSADGSVTLARARNRALIAAKNQQLPAILRDRKTDELSALVVKIEQTILDLNHESEVAKDRAQQSAAGPESAADRAHGQPGFSGLTVDGLRDLSISYRERIELLKPIAAALREEITNRNR
jgi:hypothetical protein